jgi:uncharacterized protein YraI
MKNFLWIVVVFVIALSSCNLPAEQPTETPQSTAQPTLDTPTSSIPTLTPIPINSVLTLGPATITSTSTPSTILASPKDQPVNCRFGPGTAYAVAGALNPGRQAEIIGRNSDSSWWYVRNPSNPSTSCWLAASATDTAGNVESLSVVNPPEIMVTSIDVRVDPSAMNVACDAFPQAVVLSAEITTSGPTIVTWRWESSTGIASAEKNLLFEEGGTKTVQEFYQVNSANDYSIQIRTLLPNVLIGQANFKVTCEP